MKKDGENMKFIILGILVSITLSVGYARSVDGNFVINRVAKANNMLDRYLMGRELALTLVLLPELGNELKVTINEDDKSLNAFATFDDQSNPLIIVNRGLLDHEEMTKELLDLFLCHEMGHLSGGDPKLVRRNGKLSWSSVEGQADYFAAQICMDFLGYSEDQVLSESLAFAAMIAKLKGHLKIPKLETPESYNVSRTLQTHPTPQCRLDTLVAGLRSKPRPQCWFNPKELD